jgi:signal transduction histidine kinase
MQILAPLESLESELATATYRIMQESLTNALRHAQATMIDMQVEINNAHLHLEIRDNGVGLSNDWQDSGHFGVIGMHERAQGLGGSLHLEILKPSGVRISAILPLKHNSAHG